MNITEATPSVAVLPAIIKEEPQFSQTSCTSLAFDYKGTMKKYLRFL